MTVDRNSLQFDNRDGAAGSGGTVNLGFEPGKPSPTSQGSRIASAVLSPAVQLWLRSQVQQVDELKVKIEGSDRQIFSGAIPKVTAAARGAVYKGLHLTEVALEGCGIRINLGQALKGQPLRLMESVPVAGVLRLSQADLNASLKAPLLADALSEFLLPLLPLTDREKSLKLQNSQIAIEAGVLTLSAAILRAGGRQIPLVLRTGLRMASDHELMFEAPEIEMDGELKSSDFNGFKIDFGPEVEIEELLLSPGEIVCRGGIRVLP
ncbi:LmeA family phospholipid-binding protein [Microcoleus sp. OTE_8_concoct_300]|uniref:LmeA family phospholipid-binding protein n=1 Tax=Microcoleus sp. OTE_8_concoct_300 TaxID=2964710 RepID=UPI00403F5B7D